MTRCPPTLAATINLKISKMKYKVIEQLEIRSESSLTSGQSFGILKPGFVFDVEEEVEGAILKEQ